MTTPLIFSACGSILLIASTAAYAIGIAEQKQPREPVKLLAKTFLTSVILFFQVRHDGWNVPLIPIGIMTLCSLAANAYSVERPGAIEKEKALGLAILFGIVWLAYDITPSPLAITITVITMRFFVFDILMISTSYRYIFKKSPVVWILSSLAFGCACISCLQYEWLYMLFPLYMLAISLIMIVTSRTIRPRLGDARDFNNYQKKR
jgi:hypothetical protein